ncbi:MAG: CPBP family intramembrane metalloprotease [Oscillospiraceae bacterium]|nr:CPBP family intramembrane metalloprotease [Oscillospiraceae bacterium]
MAVIIVAVAGAVVPIVLDKIKSNAVIAIIAFAVVIAETLYAVLMSGGAHRTDNWFTAAHIPRQLLIAVPLNIAQMVMLLLFAGILKLLRVKPPEPKLKLGVKNGAQLVFAIIFNFLVVGTTEEIMFRGYLLGLFRAAIGSNAWAVVIVSVLFGAIHYPGYETWHKVATTTLIGALYGTAMLVIPDCTLLTVIVAHGVNNAVAFAIRFTDNNTLNREVENVQQR